MADLGFQFDARQVEPASRPPALPDGWYNAAIIKSEMKQTKDQQGAFLELGMKVLDGPFAGRMVYDRLNLYNKNPVAVEIAQKTLSAICHATGQLVVQKTEVLHNIPLMVRVIKTAADGKYDEGNEVKGYDKHGARPATADASGAAAANPSFSPPANTPPMPPNATQAPSGPAPAPAPFPQAAPPSGPAPSFAPPPQQAAPNFAPPVQTQANTPPPAPPAGGQDATPPWLRQQ